MAGLTIDVVLHAQDDVTADVRKSGFLGHEDDAPGAIAFPADQTVRPFEKPVIGQASREIDRRGRQPDLRRSDLVNMVRQPRERCL